MVFTAILENDRMPQKDRVVNTPGQAAGGVADRTRSRGRSQGEGEKEYSQTVTHPLSRIHTRHDVGNFPGNLMGSFKSLPHWNNKAKSRGS